MYPIYFFFLYLMVVWFGYMSLCVLQIMATAGTVCIRFIIAHTHSARLIPILTNHMTSKSKDIRRAMCEFLDQLLHTWPTHILEKHVALIQSAVSNGIKDADPDARAFSRK